MAKKADDAAQPTFVVLSPVRLDGETYPVGSEIAPDEKTAGELLELGAIGEAPAKEPEPPAT